MAYRDAGKLPEAIALLERVRDATIAKLGPDHPDTLTTLNNLAAAYQAAGKLPEAIALFERVRDAQIAKLGPDHPDTLNTLNNLAAAYWSAKQLDKSVPLFEDVLKRQEAKLGRQHPDTQMTVANLGVNYKDSGRLDEAIPLLEEAYHASGKFPNLRWVGAQLLDAYAKAGRSAEAAKLVQELLADARKTSPKDSPQLAVPWRRPASRCFNSRPMPTPSRSSANAWRSARRRSPISGARSPRSRCSAEHCWARRSTPRPSRC